MMHYLKVIKSVLLLLGLIAAGLFIILTVVVTVELINITATPADTRIRQYELDGMTVRRVDKSGHAQLSFIKDQKEVDRIKLLFQDRMAWIYSTIYFQDSTIVIEGGKPEKILFPIRRKHYFITDEDLWREISVDSISSLKHSLMKQGRFFRLENVIATREDSLYNRESDYPTRVKMSVLDKDGTVIYSNQDWLSRNSE
ncbi:MAG: hypothetical protein J6W82_07295 [Bacteroidales bacterium]|nr:hypothetical protein [Bacteroidales bacterium]